MTLNDFSYLTIFVTNRLRIEVVTSDGTSVAFSAAAYPYATYESNAALDDVTAEYGDCRVCDVWQDDDTYETVIEVLA